MSERGTCPDAGKAEQRERVGAGALKWDEVIGGRRGLLGGGPAEPGWGFGFAGSIRSCSSCFHLCSGVQFQLLQAGRGVQGSVRRLQAPAEPPDGREPNLARRARAENGRRPDGEAAAAARHGGPAGTEHTLDLKMSHDTIRADFSLQEEFLFHLDTQ